MSDVRAQLPYEPFWDHSFDAYTAEGDDPFLAVSRLHDGPPVIDLDRKRCRIAFGQHNCLGVHLAKRELRIVIEEFFGRL